MELKLECETRIEEKYNTIVDFVTDVSNMKTKNYSSLTSKTLFKFMDLVEIC